MHFVYSKEHLKGTEKFLQRFFEILPGFFSWFTLISMTLLSFLQPILAAIIIIAFYFFWFLRLVYMTIFLVWSYYRLMMEKHSDWMARIEGIDHLEEYLKTLRAGNKKLTIKQRLSRYFHRRALVYLKKSRNLPPLSKDIYHLVIFPIAKEPREIIEPCIQHLSQQFFPTERIVVIYAVEERADDEVKAAVKELIAKYKRFFMHVEMVIHPTDLPGEARVKGANATYAAKYANTFFKEKKIPFENIILSCFDADTVVGPEYFSCLTYYFMISPPRLHCSFQPIPVYHNNVWEVPGFARVIETGSSFFQLIEATNPEKLVTFSSHSMSFKALVDVDYWPVDMISDDSAIFWKSYIHYDGKHRVVPMYVTLSMDIAGNHHWWETMKTVYKQKRRWAWGIENFPLVMRAFLKAKKIRLFDKVRLGFKMFEGHWSWATWGFLLTIIGWLPGLFAGREFLNSVIYYNIPRITHTIFNLASLSLLISIILSLGLLPKRKTPMKFFKKVGLALEWLLIPLVLLFFSAVPALDAQTRLMLGRYMEFWVTDKTRKKS